MVFAQRLKYKKLKKPLSRESGLFYVQKVDYFLANQSFTISGDITDSTKV